MNPSLRPTVILMAEDDADDRLLARDAFARCRIANDLEFVEDGEELLDYLRGEGKFAAPGSAPRPGIILLDLNMPRKDGREALREIKADPALRGIPVVVLTTSKDEQDILRTYDLGANSFIMKPVTFQGLVDVMQGLERYWFHMVELPVGAGSRATH
ncbi:MAG TPA: response regulator [Gemmatimonas sp.]|nr:response regulator [Gemmatimonas sp.]